MKSSDIIAFCILGILVVLTAILCDRQSMELRSINDRIALIEEQVGHGNIPRIEISGRAAVYAGSGEITIEDLSDND